LFFDLGVAVREARRHRLGGAELGEDLLLLFFELLDLPQRVPYRLVARELRAERRVLLLHLPHLVAEALVLFEQLLGELGPLLEEGVDEGVPLLPEVFDVQRRSRIGALRRAALLLAHGSSRLQGPGSRQKPSSALALSA